MGRKSISPTQRSIPVSFSVKPVLADRIEQMAYDQRFTRSRFLSEAVLRYINFIEMGGLEGSENVSDMTLGRRVLIGANALQEANRENEPLPENIIEFLKNQLSIYETKGLIREIDAKEGKRSSFAELDALIDADITFKKIPKRREYNIFNHGTQIGTIEYSPDFKAWITSIGNDRDSHRTLKHAKLTVMEAWS
jgi:hypothetical protein